MIRFCVTFVEIAVRETFPTIRALCHGSVENFAGFHHDLCEYFFLFLSEMRNGADLSLIN